MSYRNMLITMGLLAALGFGGRAAAQGPSPQPGATPGPDNAAASGPQSSSNQATQAPTSVSLSAVSVVGIRASLARSLVVKQEANAIVDVVTAEDINKFPTTNIAESLALIPGVTLDQSMPATQRVSVDGLDPSLNMSLLDGHPVAQAMWLFGDQPNRGFNFSLLPANLVSSIEVFKSPEARLPAGSLGGLIVMHTLEPLDLKSNTFSGSAGYNYSALVSQGKPNASLFYSIKNDSGTFGVDISLGHYEQVISRQGMENYGYSTVNSIAAQNPAIAAEVANGTLQGTDMMPNQLSAANFNQVERRNSIFTNIQFKPSDNFETTLSLMYMLDNLQNTNQSTYAWAALRPKGITSLGDVMNGIVTEGASVAGPGTVCQNDTAGACGQDALTLSDNFARGSEITTKGFDWRTKYTDNLWTIATQLGVSNSTNPISQVLKEIAYEDSFNWNMGQGFTFTNPATANNPNYWADYGWGGNHSLLPYAARDSYGQVDFTRSLDGFFNELLFGVRYAGHWESQSEFVYGGFPAVTLNQIGYGGLTNMQGASDLGLSSSMVSHVQTAGYGAIMNTNAFSNTANYPNSPDGNSLYDNTWNVVQENYAGYLQANFSAGPVRGNIGARVVQTHLRSQGFNVPGDCAAKDSYPCNFPAGFGWQTLTSTHTNLLPALNVAYDIAPDLVLRGAASETIAYAPYNQLAPYFEANDTVLTAASGNPNLSPYKSVNLDESLEWYFAPGSVLAGSLFYKDVKNYIVNQAVFQQRINGSWTLPGYLNSTGSAQIAAGLCTPTGLCNYSVTSPVDGGHATVNGFAVAYQQQLPSDFGLRANYTYSNAQTSSGQPMPYNSLQSFSVSPYYENGPFSASISYNWRSGYVAGGYVAGAAPTNTASYKELGAQVGYAINDNWSVNLSGMNLLNSTYYQFLANPTQLAQEYKTGRQYLLTASVKF
ncbi:MAG: TonB-dependent receptor [Gammaproteobacteria bacterium]